jgi:hypothetical protein
MPTSGVKERAGVGVPTGPVGVGVAVGEEDGLGVEVGSGEAGGALAGAVAGAGGVGVADWLPHAIATAATRKSRGRRSRELVKSGTSPAPDDRLLVLRTRRGITVH